MNFVLIDYKPPLSNKEVFDVLKSLEPHPNDIDILWLNLISQNKGSLK